MFAGFAEWDIETGDGVTLHGRSGGSGPAVLLLHGHPRTHTTWHRVAPTLAASGYSVVCPDLRGYGRSTFPSDGDYSKRAMARDMAGLMRTLGHESYTVCGHDRGSYVALRLALDSSDTVRALAVLDSVPIGEALARADARFAQAWWHWFFFAQPDRPERAILADPNAWYTNDPDAMGEENWADYQRAIHDPATVHAMLEDYRAGLGIDRQHDDADRAAGRTVSCPTLVAWSARDDMERLYGDVLSVWRPWAPDLRGAVIDSGHHMAEQAPGQLAETLIDFLGGRLSAAEAPPVIDPADLYRRYLACCNEHRFDRLGEFVAGDVAVDGEPVGLIEYAARLSAVAAFSRDYRWTIEHLLVDGSSVSAHLRTSGTHTGRRWGLPPTGRAIGTQEFALYRLRDGKIAEVWGTADDLDLLRQIGGHAC